MNQSVITLLHCLVLIIFGLLYTLLPVRLKKKDIYFGYRIRRPDAQISQLLRYILLSYQVFSGSVTVILVAACILAGNSLPPLTLSFVLAGLLLGLLLFEILLYGIARRNVRKIAIQLTKTGSISESADGAYIDISQTEEQFCVPACWFVSPLALMLATAGILFYFYPYIAPYVTLVVDLFGNALVVVSKTYVVILLPVLLQLLFLLISFGIYWKLRSAVLEVDPVYPKQSLYQNRRKRFVWSAYLVIVSFGVCLVILTCAQLLFIMPQLKYLTLPIVLCSAALLLAVTIYLAIRTKRKSL